MKSEPQSPRHRLQERNIAVHRTYAENSLDGPSLGAHASNASNHNRVAIGNVADPPGIIGQGVNIVSTCNLTSLTIHPLTQPGNPHSGRPAPQRQKQSQSGTAGTNRPVLMPPSLAQPGSPRTPSSWRHKDPHRRHIRFRKSSSPIYVPSTPPTRFTLRVSFFTDVYALPITSATSLAGAMRPLRDASDAGFDDAVWSTLAIAPEGEKEQWTEAQWEQVKEAAMYTAEEEVVGRVVRRT